MPCKEYPSIRTAAYRVPTMPRTENAMTANQLGSPRRYVPEVSHEGHVKTRNGDEKGSVENLLRSAGEDLLSYGH